MYVNDVIFQTVLRILQQRCEKRNKMRDMWAQQWDFDGREEQQGLEHGSLNEMRTNSADHSISMSNQYLITNDLKFKDIERWQETGSISNEKAGLQAWQEN